MNVFITHGQLTNPKNGTKLLKIIMREICGEPLDEYTTKYNFQDNNEENDNFQIAKMFLMAP